MSTAAKRRFLVVYDYGQGGVWALIDARSPDEIAARYPELEVVLQRPEWLTDDRFARLEQVDVDQPPTGWIARMIEERDH